MSAYLIEKERKRIERDERRLSRIMAAPPARGEMLDYQRSQLENITSIALALEALDGLLIAKGILVDNELIDATVALARTKAEQVHAKAVTSLEGQIVTPA